MATKWQNIKDNLINIKEGLKKEKEWSPYFIEKLRKVIIHILHTLSIKNIPRIETRLERIEALMILNTKKLKV